MPLRLMPRFTRLILIFTGALFVVASVYGDEAPIYEKQVGPFFKTYCLGCHDGGDDSKGGLNLLTHKSLMAGGDSGMVVVPGKSAESRLIQLLTGQDEPHMPPKDSKQPSAAEIELVRRWVDAGAKEPSTAFVLSASDLKVKSIRPKTAAAAGISAVAFSPNGHWIAAARHRDLLLIQAASLRVEQTLAGADNPINAIAFSPDSSHVAVAEGLPSVVGQVRLWNIGNPESRLFTGHSDSIYALAFNPTGDRLVTASYDKLLLLWDPSSGKELRELKHHTGSVFSAAFSPDGKSIVSAGADGTVKFWNTETGQRIVTLTEALKGVNAVVYHPRGHEIAAAGSDKMIRIYEWNGTTARLKRSAFAHDAPILSLVYSPDGNTLYSGAEDRRVKAWDASSLQERHVYADLGDWPQTLAIRPDGMQLVVGFSNGDLIVFDSKSPRKVGEILKSGQPVVAAAAGGRPRSLIELTASLPIAQTTGDDAAKPKPNPPMPRLDAISPRYVQRGQKLKFTLSGQNIADADRLFISHGQVKAALVPGDGKNVNQAFCELDLPADLPLGMVAVRLHTPLGSTAARSFYVGPARESADPNAPMYTEVSEKEENGKRENATPAKLPSTLVGTIANRGDRDLWSIEAPAGKDVVFVLFGSQMGSSLNAKLSLLDAEGRVVDSAVRQPWMNEIAVGHRFEKSQACYVQVEDRDFTGGGNHFYYIHAGTFPYVESVFPLGIKTADGGGPAADQVQAIETAGFNLPAGFKFGPVPGVGTRFLPTKEGEVASFNLARFESSLFPEFAEIEPNNVHSQARLIPIPGAISGRVSNLVVDPSGVRLQTRKARPASDVDVVAFDARRGERLTIEVFARRLGSALDSFIEILDAEGRSVPRYTLRSVAETYCVLRDHDSRSKGIRLQHWEDVQPNDLMMLGDEVVKVQILPLGPDEDVKFFDKGGLRLGFLGTTPEAHAINSFAYKVEVHPPGTTFPANGMPVVNLFYQNDDGGPGFGSDSQVLFDAPADGRYYVRLRDTRLQSDERFFYRLVIRPRHEDFRISLDPENPNIPRGGSLPVTVNLDRFDGFNEWVDVRLEGLPPGITATATRIGPDMFSAMLTLTAAEETLSTAEAASQTAEQPALPASFKVIGSAKIGDQIVERLTTPGFGIHEATITSPPDLKVLVEPSVAAIKPGEEFRFNVTLERRNGFTGRVPVDVLNLPHGLRVLDVGLNGVLINENETSRSFVVACDPWAPPGPLLFYAAPKVEAKNERHGSAPITLNVQVDRPVAEK